ncbi:MAG: response regulator [Rhodothermales bacterium]
MLTTEQHIDTTPDDSGMNVRSTIMVVEDNEWVQNYVQKIFAEDYDVVVAADGVYALEKLDQITPDLIILDIMMPRMDGNELFKRLKENAVWSNIPVIIFSAMSSEENRLEGLEKGADDYIGKPFNPRELIARARNLITIRRQERELSKLNNELESRVQKQVALIMSERKRYERELIQAKDKAEESDKLKSFILKNMSHEIRTPITNILGFAEILSERVGEEDRQFTAYIDTNGKRLLETVTSILDFSKLTTDQFELQPVPTEVSQLSIDAVTRYEEAAHAKGLEISAESEVEATTVNIDRAAVDRILNHLLSNAIKFTQKGSIVVRSRAMDDGVYFEVQDTGVGIGETFHSELFAPFKQESVGESRSFEGTGLGLSISKRLVDVMGGTISFETEKGVGSTFKVFVPSQTRANAFEGRPPIQHARPAAVGQGIRADA